MPFRVADLKKIIAMLKSLQKNWIYLLGGFFLLLSLIYFFKLAIDENWIPPQARVAIGLFIGSSGLFGAYHFFKRESRFTSELLGGLSVSIIYATFTYTSFSQSILWTPNTLMVVMLGFTSLVTLTAYKLDLRLSIFVSILGGLISPLLLKAGENQLTTLYLYLIVLNVAALVISTKKNWVELRVLSFFATGITYITYYIHFDPVTWQKPLFYSTSFFITYLIGLVISSKFEKKNFNGVNLYLGTLNGLLFVLGSVLILGDQDVSYIYPLIGAGILFIGAAASILFYSKKKAIVPSIVYFAIGLISIAAGCGDLGLVFPESNIHLATSSIIWTSLSFLIFFTGKKLKQETLQFIGFGAWVLTTAYWYSVAWEVEWVEFLGLKYIPFFNIGAVAWICLTVVGFLISKHFDSLEKEKGPDESTLFKAVSLCSAIIAHIIIGGLLTVQIENTWEAYNIYALDLGLTMSVVWLIYASTLFLWGSYSQQKTFRVFGSIVLIMTSLKVLTFDLAGAHSLNYVFFLMLCGILIILIAYINKKWQDKAQKSVASPSSIDLENEDIPS